MRNTLITFAGFLGAIGALVWWIYSLFRPTVEIAQGSGGLGVVTGLPVLLLLLTLLGLALVGLWTVIRAIVCAAMRSSRSG